MHVARELTRRYRQLHLTERTSSGARPSLLSCRKNWAPVAAMTRLAKGLAAAARVFWIPQPAKGMSAVHPMKGTCKSHHIPSLGACRTLLRIQRLPARQKRQGEARQLRHRQPRCTCAGPSASQPRWGVARVMKCAGLRPQISSVSGSYS